LAPSGSDAFFANDVAVDNLGNAYVSDWYAKVIYKVTLDGKPSLFWKSEFTGKGGPNGLDYHPDGYLLVSLLSVDQKGLYSNYGLVKIPVDSRKTATMVKIKGTGFAGFDGMVINDRGHVIGVSNNSKVPGGNMLLELEGSSNWESAEIVQARPITNSTTVAITPENMKYVINQDFTDGNRVNWTIEKIDW